jgi:hypothetical protein
MVGSAHLARVSNHGPHRHPSRRRACAAPQDEVEIYLICGSEDTSSNTRLLNSGVAPYSTPRRSLFDFGIHVFSFISAARRGYPGQARAR